MRPLGRPGAFGPFPCKLAFIVFVAVRSVNLRAPSWLSGSFRCIRSIPVRPWGSSGSFGCVRSIPVRPICRRVHVSSGSLVCVRFILVRCGGRRVRFHSPLGAFRQFPCALVSSGSFGCVWSIPVVVGLVQVRSVNSCAPWESSCSFRWVWSVRVRPGSRRVRSCEYSAFLRAHWGLCGSFGYFRSIPVRPGGRRVRLGSVGPFQFAQGVMREQSRAPGGSTRSFGFFRYIPVRSGCRRVR